VSFATLAVLIGLGVIVTIAMVLGSAAFSSTRRTTRLIHCPVSKKRVAVEFVEMVTDGQVVDVTECSMFGSGKPVTCDKYCVDDQHRADGLPISAAYV
jgi:hypothetical protein